MIRAAPTSVREAWDRLARDPRDEDAREWWSQELRTAPLDEIAALIGRMWGAAPDEQKRHEALRDEARAAIDERLAQRMIERMESLERQAGRLTIAGWVVAAALTVAAAWVGR